MSGDVATPVRNRSADPSFVVADQGSAIPHSRVPVLARVRVVDRDGKAIGHEVRQGAPHIVACAPDLDARGRLTPGPPRVAPAIHPSGSAAEDAVGLE